MAKTNRTKRTSSKGSAKSSGTKPETSKTPETLEEPTPASWPHRWPRKFLDALRETRSVSKAATLAGVARRTVYDLRDRDGEFLVAWEDALEASIEDLEASAFQKAKDGWLEPVYYKGSRVGVRNRYAPGLAMWFLAKLRPELYNIPTFDPLTVGGDGESATSTTPAVMFYPDADEARRKAEELDRGET